MADSLVDLGNGVKMINPAVAVGNEGTATHDAISLLSLQQQAVMLPLQLKKLQIETALGANELMNTNVKNLMDRAQLFKTLGDEQRARAGFYFEHVKDLPNLYRVGKDFGDAALKQLNPDASSTENKDGTISIDFPSQEVQNVAGTDQTVPTRQTLKFALDPKQLAPEKKLELEGQWQAKFENDPAIKRWNDISPFYQNVKSAGNIENPTGQSDTALMLSFFKMINPQARINPGEPLDATQMENVPTALVNAYNKSILDGAPIFGKKGSESRKNFITSADLFAQNARQDALSAGRHYADFGNREGMDARNIVSPQAGISQKDFLLTDSEILKNMREKLNAPAATEAAK